MKLSGFTKNLIALIIITIVIGALTEYFEIAAFLFPLMVLAVAIWFMISPFKLNDDV